MDDRVRRWMKVFQEFSTEQRKESLNSLVEFLSADEKHKKSITEEIGVIMGPLSGRCPYCGK
jgi:hypothetical protein